MNTPGQDKRLSKRMREDFAYLASHLRGIASAYEGRVYYLPNVGNWGDALIRQGTLKFFHDHGIEYVEIPTRNGVSRSLKGLFPKESLLIMGGGGAWCRNYRHGIRILDLLWESFEEVIVLPTTYEHALIVPNAQYWSRDKDAHYDILPMNRSNFCHDLALYLVPPTSALEIVQRVKKEQEQKKSPPLYIFRSDPERSEKVKVPDMNKEGEIYAGRHNHLSPVGDFFERIAMRGPIVHTDRLHAAIASCLLGLETHLYPGSYGKNFGVFTASIQLFFDCHFHNEFPCPLYDYEKQTWRPMKMTLKYDTPAKPAKKARKKVKRRRRGK